MSHKPPVHPIVVLILLLLATLISPPALAGTPDLKAVRLRTEYKINPVIDVANPRLSWELTSAVRGQVQTGYQIMVASSAQQLAAGKADLWDSGKVPGSATNQIEYAGKALPARTVCYWKVRSWDKTGNPARGVSPPPMRWVCSTKMTGKLTGLATT